MKRPIPLTTVVLGTLMAMALFPLKLQAQDARMPKVDFSEMEKEYEIVKWSYEPSGYIRLVLVPKHDGPHEIKFGFKYFDATGATVDGPSVIFNNGFSTPAGQEEKGEAYAPDEATLKKVKSVIVYQVHTDGTLIGPAPPKVAPMIASPVPKTVSNSARAVKPISLGAKAGQCSFEKQPASSPRAKYSAPLIKSLLYERYSFEKNTGGLSSPLEIGVKFLSIKMLGSYMNTVRIVPGRGAQRKNDGAPVNAVVYRFHAKYIVCRKYSDSTRMTQYESNNTCFKAKNGQWDCAVDSVPKIQDVK